MARAEPHVRPAPSPTLVPHAPQGATRSRAVRTTRVQGRLQSAARNAAAGRIHRVALTPLTVSCGDGCDGPHSVMHKSWHLVFNTAPPHPHPPAPNARAPALDPNDDANATAVSHWLAFSDFYTMPHIITFDSPEHAVDIIASTDFDGAPHCCQRPLAMAFQRRDVRLPQLRRMRRPRDIRPARRALATTTMAPAQAESPRSSHNTRH